MGGLGSFWLNIDACMKGLTTHSRTQNKALPSSWFTGGMGRKNQLKEEEGEKRKELGPGDPHTRNYFEAKRKNRLSSWTPKHSHQKERAASTRTQGGSISYRKKKFLTSRAWEEGGGGVRSLA